jgi:hypothetical protein
MATIGRFEEIVSWKESRKLNQVVGDLIDTGRFKNSYRLINQIEGSAGLIMGNIAEGFERGGNRPQLYRAPDRKYILQDEFDSFSVEAMKISSLIQKLIKSLKPLKPKE